MNRIPSPWLCHAALARPSGIRGAHNARTEETCLEAARWRRRTARGTGAPRRPASAQAGASLQGLGRQVSSIGDREASCPRPATGPRPRCRSVTTSTAPRSRCARGARAGARSRCAARCRHRCLDRRGCPQHLRQRSRMCRAAIARGRRRRRPLRPRRRCGPHCRRRAAASASAWASHWCSINSDCASSATDIRQLGT